MMTHYIISEADIPKEKKLFDNYNKSNATAFNSCRKQFISKLKPVEWSEEEHKIINFIIDKLEGYELDCLREPTNDEMRQKRFRLAHAIYQKFNPKDTPQ